MTKLLWPCVLFCLLIGGVVQAQVLDDTVDHPEPQGGAIFGRELNWIGDVNGDTVPDLAVGATQQDVGVADQGRVYVVSGVNGSLLLTLDNPTGESGFFGSFPAAVGDVNGDLVPDVLVGAFRNDGSGTDVGQAFIMSGADAGVLRTLDHPSPQSSAFLGSYNSGIGGDVDGDLVPDVAVGAPGEPFGACNCPGQAWIFSGADGTVIHPLPNPSPQNGDRFGFVIGIDDVTGDLIRDVAVGAQNYDGAFGDQGRAYVFSGADGSLARTLEHPEPQAGAGFGSGFGLRMAGLGDVNGDLVPDIAVTATFQDVAGETDQGRVYIMSGADGSYVRTLDAPVPGAGLRFGSAVAAAGDRNGDLVPDVAVGADTPGQQGRLWIFSGADGSMITEVLAPSPTGGALFGSCFNDFAGDRLAVGACTEGVGGNSQQGRVYLYTFDPPAVPMLTLPTVAKFALALLVILGVLTARSRRSAPSGVRSR